MLTFNLAVLSVLSCIAMVGAIPIGNDAPAGSIARRQLYVPYQQRSQHTYGYSDQLSLT